ncbi:MAG TPA: outer membrane beta-barrel protein [Stellaceae bacterium]|nr:outer membrane beta-barrel protein [Stellaceae bacterium]
MSLALPMSAEAQQAAPPAPSPMSTPAMAGPLAANPNPYSVDLGPLGKTYITGELTGIGFGQTNPTSAASALGAGIPANRTWEADLSNGMVQIQKTDGLFQYFIQAGGYSFPVLGVPYADASHTTSNTFGLLPQAYVKLVPNDNWSIEAGKLPTLIGAEGTYTFQNMNIERGLLWNQENIFNRGVQINYSTGPLALSLSWNDGFYSNDYTYLTGAATWTFNSTNSLTFAGGGNTATTTTTIPSATGPVAGIFNDQQMYDISFLHTSGPWTLNPYIQYTHAPAVPALGTTTSGSTYGAALLVDYTFDSSTMLGGMSLGGFSLPFRAEYISSDGSTATGPNLLGYGAGSKAWSLTITPTYQYKIFFTRVEASYVGADKTAPGSVFGFSGNDKSQFRGLIEAGFLF